MKIPKIAIKKEHRGRIISTGNIIIFAIVLFCSGWIVKGWFVDWHGTNVTFGEIIADGGALLWDFLVSPGSKTELTNIITAVLVALSGGLQIYRLWRKRKR